MNYYESVVMDYLRSDRGLFINTECCIQLNEGDNPDSSGPHWYCDAVAADFRSSTVFLCEVSYSGSLEALGKRLRGWHDNWDLLKLALVRDSQLPGDWKVRPWLFVPEQMISVLLRRLDQIVGTTHEQLPEWFVPKVTTLEMVQPWRYRSWNRAGEASKPDSIPVSMH